MAKQRLLDKLKASVFEDKAEPEASVSGPVFGTGRTAQPPSAYAAAGPAYAPSADPQLVAEVEQALAGQSPPAYSQFGSLLSSMSMIPDEGMRYKAAISAASTTLNLQPTAIRDAYEARIAALGRISTKFAVESDAELKRMTAAGESNLEGLRSRQATLERQLATVGAEAQQVKEQVAQQEQQLMQDRQEIADTQQRFGVAVKSVAAKVAAELDVVRNNIGGV